MTDDERKILEFFEQLPKAVSGAEAFRPELKPVFDALVAKGFLEAYACFKLSEAGFHALRQK